MGCTSSDTTKTTEEKTNDKIVSIINVSLLLTAKIVRKHNCKEMSGIKLWCHQHGKPVQITCSVDKCTYMAKYATMVYIEEVCDDTKVFLIPICDEHTHTSTSFTIKDGIQPAPCPCTNIKNYIQPYWGAPPNKGISLQIYNPLVL
jgi:hypothetical protein